MNPAWRSRGGGQGEAQRTLHGALLHRDPHALLRACFTHLFLLGCHTHCVVGANHYPHCTDEQGEAEREVPQLAQGHRVSAGSTRFQALKADVQSPRL